MIFANYPGFDLEAHFNNGTREISRIPASSEVGMKARPFVSVALSTVGQIISAEQGLSV